MTRRERLLGEMNAVIPWESLIGLIEPHCPKVGKGRQPLGLEGILRIYFLQQWFDLSDPAAEDALYASESMRRFAGITLAEDKVPDESTILRFRHLLGKNDLTEAIFGAVRSLLEGQHILVKSATIVDATISSFRRPPARPRRSAQPVQSFPGQRIYVLPGRLDDSDPLVELGQVTAPPGIAL